MNIAASWLASTTPMHYWCKSMAQLNQAITFWVLESLNVCQPLSKCTRMHTHTDLLTNLALKAGRKCWLMRNQLVTCAAFPVPDDLLRTSQRHEWSHSRVLDCGLLVSDWLIFFLFLQMIFQHAESGAKDEICPNRSSLICQPWNDTRTRSWWKVTLISVEMERHRPLLDEEWRCVVSQLNGQTKKQIFF